MIAAPHSPTSADYGDEYFATLYGDVPRQTPIDIARDRLIRRLVLRFKRGGDLLEIGCGFGYLLGAFAHGAPAGWRLFGTDISAHAAGMARWRLGLEGTPAHIVASDIQQGIPYRGAFDVIIAVNVMEHLPDPQSGAAAIAAALRPGGLFVAHLPTINGPLSRRIYARTYASDPTHVYRPSGAAFNQVIEAAGFRTLRALYCPFWPAPLWRWLQPHPAYLAVFERR